MKFNNKSLIILLVVVANCATPISTAPVAVHPASLDTQIVSLVQSNIKEIVKDPESAKFRRETGFTTDFGDYVLCGEFDAKNSFGGYTGYDAYYYRVRNGIVMAKQLDRRGLVEATKACREAASGTLLLPKNQLQN